MNIDVGDRFPDITLPDAEGEPTRLKDLRAGRNLVVFFYPKDGTPGCTKEACAFRDAYEDFRSADTEVVGISSDGPESHRAFAARHGLPFPLLCDEGGKVREELGIPKTLGLFDGRVTFVVDKEGIVRRVFNSQVQAQRHVREALDALVAA